ncbi:hypothetical protein [Candidatus Protochlamydia sp. R18]|uniref:hypothetical protein n=1 Tax=Candidatus Protochlamydia sp. R18 TaxID=1353977 RepID=UPI0005A7394F|nr:hypothetical protein [Candidatus Protochlamydia sp. R18]
MINLFPVMEHPTFVEHDFESKYSNKIPRLAQRVIVAAGFGFFYGKMFEVSRHQTAKVFAITELARNILRLLIIKGDSSIEQQKLASGLFFVDTVCNAALAVTMYKLNLIAVPGLLAFSVFYALYFTERFVNVQQIASENDEEVVTTERVVTMQGIPSSEGRASLEQGQPSSLEPAQQPNSEQT